MAMLIYNDMILLDLAGPMTVLALAMSDIHLVAKNRNPVRSDGVILVQPSTTFDDCPSDLDVIFVPGGLGGSIAAMDDEGNRCIRFVAFVSDRGEIERSGSQAFARALWFLERPVGCRDAASRRLR